MSAKRNDHCNVCTHGCVQPVLSRQQDPRTLIMSSIKTFLTAVFLLPILLTSLAHAQIRSATIAGTVHDASGAVIAAADIALANQETGITASMKTAESGQFAFPYLPAGLYTVTVTSPGFNTFKQSGINLSTAQTARVDITLKLSSVDTTVEVQAQAATIQTDTTSVSGGLQARAIDAIPNITQNPLYYAFLPQAYSRATRPPARPTTTHSASASTAGVSSPLWVSTADARLPTTCSSTASR